MISLKNFVVATVAIATAAVGATVGAQAGSTAAAACANVECLGDVACVEGSGTWCDIAGDNRCVTRLCVIE